MTLMDMFPLDILTSNDYVSLVPLMLLSFGAIVSLLVGTHKTRGHRNAFIASGMILGLCVVVLGMNAGEETTVLLKGTLIIDSFTRTLSFFACSFALIALIITRGTDVKEHLLSEVYALILFSTAGMVLMMSTNHLLFMFIALEIMSLAVYVMVAMRRTSYFSAEAGLKYFILGGLGSAFLLYGSSLIFGATGSFDLPTIKAAITSQTPTAIYYVGLGLVLTAMLFKVGAVPFHGWVPDVYQGAATNVTAFMSAGVKFTAFMALARIAQNTIFAEGVPGMHWFESYIWLVAAASMIYGNFVAISQDEVKRMLSFSTIAHTGYLLLGLYAMKMGAEATQSMIVYLFFYALSSLGAFAIVAQFEIGNEKDVRIDQLAGMGLRHPIMGACMTIFLLSMAGIPLTSGFIGKYGLFNTAVNAGQVPLVVIAVLTSVVSVYYYLRVIVYMYMKEADGNEAVFQNMRGAGLAATLSAAATVQFGLFPRAILELVKHLGK
jgi:NADH-quinone oxidoreductase subunit N